MIYPSEELVTQWAHEWARHKGPQSFGVHVHDYVARKACDWQREQLAARESSGFWRDDGGPIELVGEDYD